MVSPSTLLTFSQTRGRANKFAFRFPKTSRSSGENFSVTCSGFHGYEWRVLVNLNGNPTHSIRFRGRTVNNYVRFSRSSIIIDASYSRFNVFAFGTTRGHRTTTTRNIGAR